MLIDIKDSFDNALLFTSEHMQDGVGLEQIKNTSFHESHSVTPVDGMDLINIIQ